MRADSMWAVVILIGVAIKLIRDVIIYQSFDNQCKRDGERMLEEYKKRNKNN